MSDKFKPEALSFSSLHIKHMVCPRCIYVVKTELEGLKLPVKEIRLGEVVFMRSLSEENLLAAKEALEKFGFELIQDSKSRIIEQIKTLIIEITRYNKKTSSINNSEYLAKELVRDYSVLSHLFSASEGITIEKYIILQRIEYAKELLSYNELSLSQIASELAYSDVGYLSRQFKAVTGVTPTAYKKQNCQNRKFLNEVIPEAIVQN